MTTSIDRRIVLFDLFGVIARDQRPGALGEMAARCHTPTDAFTTAYWDCRPPYDAGQQSASEYWTAVLRRLSLAVDAKTIEELRLADIDSWSRVDDRMVAYAQSLRDVAEVALLSNIPSDHADAFLAAQPWLRRLDHVAFSGKIKAAKPLGGLPPRRRRPAGRSDRLPLRRRPRGERTRRAGHRHERTRLHRSRRAGGRHRHLVADPTARRPDDPRGNGASVAT